MTEESNLLASRMYSQQDHLPIRRNLQHDKNVYLRQSFPQYDPSSEQDFVYFHFENEERRLSVKAEYAFKLTGYTLEDEQEPGVWSFVLKPGEQLVKRMKAPHKKNDAKALERDKVPNDFKKISAKFEFYR